MEYIKLNKESGSTTRINFNNGVPYISYRILDDIPWLKNAVSTRLGGVSKDYLASMNLGFNRGDLDENVIRNHEIFANVIGVNPKNIVTGNQTHTTNVKVVTKDDCGKGIYRDRNYTDIDGLITNEKGIVLATYYADCVPLLIVDTKNKAIGLSHSGWRGTVGKIWKSYNREDGRTYGTKPEDIVACIGPSICQKCYEISEEVAVQFKEAFPDNIKEILIDKGNGKYQLDLWECNRINFKEAGVLPENIKVTDICTCHNTDVLFSHRGHNGKRGNIGAFYQLYKLDNRVKDIWKMFTNMY